MALIRATTSGSGGGKVDEGTFALAYGTTTEYTVNCGFQPKKAVVYKVDKTGSSSPYAWTESSRVDIFDVDMNPQFQFRTLIVGGEHAQSVPLPETGDSFTEINSSGFKFAISSNYWDGTYRYFAVG